MPNPPPAAAYHLEVEGDEFVVFVWNTEATEPALSKSLREVLALILRGCTNSEIALARGTSERTIANQVARLLKEFGAGSRFELIARLGPARVDR